MKSSMRTTSNGGMITIARFSRINSGQATPTYSKGQVPEESGQVMTINKQL